MRTGSIEEKGGDMNKDHGRRTRRSAGEPLTPATVRIPKRARIQTASTADIITRTGGRLASSTAAPRGGLAQDFIMLAATLGHIAAQALWHVQSGRLSGTMARAHRLVRQHPLQAVVLAAGLGSLLARTKVG